MKVAKPFTVNELVRDPENRILTIRELKGSQIYVQEDPYHPYSLVELEKIDQTNVVKFVPRY